MNKIAIAGLVVALSSTTALAEDQSILSSISVTAGAERELEAETNVLYGSVGIGMASIGVTFEDTPADAGKFNAQKYELDFAQPLGPVTLYMENDFDDGFKHAETVVGGKVTF